MVASPLPRSRVKPVSTKRAKLNRELAAVVAEKRKTVRHCQAQPLLKAALSHEDNTEADRRRYVEALRDCTWEATEAHHILKRSRGSSSTLTDPTNLLMLDHSCHLFTESEVLLSTRAGLVLSSSDYRRWGLGSRNAS